MQETKRAVDKFQWDVKNTPVGKALSDSWDGVVVAIDAGIVEKKSLSEALSFLDRSTKETFLAYAQRFEFKAKAGDTLSFDFSPSLRVVLVSVALTSDPFDFLTVARESWEPLFSGKVRKAGVDLRGIAAAASAAVLADSFASAHAAKRFDLPKYTEKKEASQRQAPAVSLEFWVGNAELVSEVKKSVQQALALTEGTNLVRFLSLLPPDLLGPTSYVKRMKDEAKEQSVEFEFFDEKALLKRKAGAFLAVTRGSDDHGGGIVRLRHVPRAKKKSTKKVAFVGKGITFDTGGHNLKTDGHMFGMHGDMAGSAVAAALVFLARKNDWPIEVEAYLAIADNAIGPKSFRCNEVIRASNGKTIEVIDTDAEGRMVLSDTLVLASESKPNLIVDFATLTGSCIRAIGKNYCGVYTNQRTLHADLVEAGRESGERVWPFPLDADYGKCLKSEVADIKQCRNSGGVDHIEASYFLSQFVGEKIQWVHTDLSAMENDDGLAHVPPKVTGFGVRFAAHLVRRIAKSQWNMENFPIA